MKKRNDKKGRRRIIDYWKIPHIRTAFVIGGVSIATLIVSGILYLINADFWSSIFANLFAGLVTGVVICLISGIKQMSVAKLKSKKVWLENLSKLLKSYFSDYHRITLLRFDKFDCEDVEMFDFIYSAASHANWINDEICQSSFNKNLSFNSIEYCKSEFDYDAVEMCKHFEYFHNQVYLIDVDCPSSSKIKGYFAVVNPDLRKLSSAVHNAIREIDIQIAEIEKTVI